MVNMISLNIFCGSCNNSHYGHIRFFFPLKVDYQKGKILKFFLIQSQASLENSGSEQLNLFLWVLVDPELIMGTSIFIRSGRTEEEKKIQMFQRN